MAARIYTGSNLLLGLFASRMYKHFPSHPLMLLQFLNYSVLKYLNCWLAVFRISCSFPLPQTCIINFWNRPQFLQKQNLKWSEGSQPECADVHSFEPRSIFCSTLAQIPKTSTACTWYCTARNTATSTKRVPNTSSLGHEILGFIFLFCS